MKNDLAEISERLVTLYDGQRGLRAGMSVKATSDGKTPMCTFVSSDATLDRYNEIIQADGWVLDNYLRNPVFQDSHCYDSVVCTIGKATRTIIKDGALIQDVLFAVGENPLAKLAYDLYRGGFLNAVSVGFIPIEWTNGDQSAGYRRKYTRQELLETSAVSIPANPNALALAYKNGAVEKGDLRELGKLLKHFLDRGEIDNRQSTIEKSGQETENPCPECGIKLIQNLETKVLTCRRCGFEQEATAEEERNAVDRRSIFQDPQLLKLFRETADVCRRA